VWCYTADAFYNVPKPSAAPAGRVLNCGPSATVDNESTANYLIIATRGASSPTTALHQSWGQVKARYQNTPGTTVTPGANDR
jgi:hypothetical protein